MKTIMLVFGTRPEAIKMCPLVNELKSRKNVNTVVCVTGQHRQMLDMVLDTFGVVPDYDLSIMKAGQTLFDITTNILVFLGIIIIAVFIQVAQVILIGKGGVFLLFFRFSPCITGSSILGSRSPDITVCPLY